MRSPAVSVIVTVFNRRQFISDAIASALAQDYDDFELIHRPFLQEALVHQSVPCAMGALFRRAGVNWQDIPDEVGSFYDYWMGYLASRDDGAAVYDPARLTRYRVHSAMETALLGGARRVVALRQLEFIQRTFLSDTRLSAVRSALAGRYVRNAARLVLTELSNGRREEATRSSRARLQS